MPILREMYIIYILLPSLLLVNAKEEINVFDKLSFLNEEWLKATSFPEVATLLQHPPYSYHSNVLLHRKEKGTQSVVSLKDIRLSPAKNQNEVCSRDLVRIISNITSSWSLQMLDSDGKLSSGLLRGGVIWPGHFGECISTYAPPDAEGNDEFRGQYCVTSWTLNVSKTYSNLPLSVGICVPNACSEEFITNLGRNAFYILDRFPLLKKYSSHLYLNNVSCKLSEKKFDAPSIIYFVFISMFLGLVVSGTIVTICKNRKVTESTCRNETESVTTSIQKTHDKDSIEAQIKIDSISSSMNSEKNILQTDTAVLTTNSELGNTAEDTYNMKQAGSILQRILECFSAIKNGEKILNVQTSGDQLLSIHGIRFLSLTWVILGHTYITSIAIIGNRIDVLKEMDSWSFQMLLQAPLSVDSFFVLSGFLLTYLFLKEIDKKNGKINWAYFYLHRIWRLTPAYMVVVFFYIYVFKYFGSGPFWDDHHCEAVQGSWWKFLLYINNFIPIKQMCIGWSWYLANDMQFYIISPLFLYPLWRWPKVGFCVLFSILLGTWITTGALSYYYDLIPMFVGVTQTKDFAAYTKKMWDSFDLVYDKPYCRIAPYIIGVALGYILYRINHRKNFLSWWQQMVGWSIAAFCGLSVVFGLYHVTMSRTTALFHNSLSRSAFSLSLAWLIFACETGHAGFLNKFLSWKLWIPLSRLTYCAYLIHPVFIHGYYQAYQTDYFFTEFSAVTNFLGFLVISYSAAFLFSIVFESPLMNLEKLLLKSKSK